MSGAQEGAADDGDRHESLGLGGGETARSEGLAAARPTQHPPTVAAAGHRGGVHQVSTGVTKGTGHTQAEV